MTVYGKMVIGSILLDPKCSLMQQVSDIVWLSITVLFAAVSGKTVTTKMEVQMTEALTKMMDNMTNSDGMRFMVPGIIRLCFHDCVIKCDGCIDMRRKFQPGNNGDYYY